MSNLTHIEYNGNYFSKRLLKISILNDAMGGGGAQITVIKYKKNYTNVFDRTCIKKGYGTVYDFLVHNSSQKCVLDMV